MDSTKDEFGDRLLYVGLQGSYLRGEATESSDIDIMVGF
ncbi:MAG: nucleotidyltransferase domain-containing protein [Lachnospiraceae bacterium]|nr:nucleotidyltransferase domain-containing protein [Lachnospiraceae bacterium]